MTKAPRTIVHKAQSRTAIVTLGATAIASFAMLAIFTSFLLPPFTGLERKLSKQDVARTVQVLQGSTDAMARVAWEYGSWDDSYNWLQGKLPTYLDVNFTEEILKDMGYEILAVLDGDGRPFWSNAKDRKSGEAIPLQELMQPLPASSILRAEHESIKGFKDMRRGFTLLSGKLYAIAICPVIPTGGGKAPVGTLWMAQRVSSDLVGKLSAETGLSLTLQPSAGTPTPPDSQVRIHGETVYIQVPIPLLEGGEGGLLVAERPAQVVIEGRQTVYLALALTWAAIIFVMCMVLIALRRVLVAPLEALQDRIKSVHRSGNLESRVSATGSEEITGIAGSFNDLVAQLQDSTQRVEELATTDPVTHLANRRSILETMERLVEKSRLEPMPMCLVLLDVDKLRAINEACGILVGDRVLLEIGHCLQSEMRVMDHVGRVAGDEFLAILPQLKKEAAFALAEKLRHAIAELRFGLHSAQVTVSIGVCKLDPANPQESMANAEYLLSQAKAAGGNKVLTTV